jgi:hypothetical protein
MRIAAISAAAILLAGCNEVTTGQQFGIASVRQIEVGKTDKATVRQLLGSAPQTAISGKNEETWVYAYSSSGSDAGQHFATSSAATYGLAIATAFTPFGALAAAPALVGTGDTTYKTQTETLTIAFKGNLVSSCKLTQAAHTTKAGTGLFTAGVKQTQESHEVPCNQFEPQQGNKSS